LLALAAAPLLPEPTKAPEPIEPFTRIVVPMGFYSHVDRFRLVAWDRDQRNFVCVDKDGPVSTSKDGLTWSVG
jgi:hypothetical protein